MKNAGIYEDGTELTTLEQLIRVVQEQIVSVEHHHPLICHQFPSIELVEGVLEPVIGMFGNVGVLHVVHPHDFRPVFILPAFQLRGIRINFITSKTKMEAKSKGGRWRKGKNIHGSDPLGRDVLGSQDNEVGVDLQVGEGAKQDTQADVELIVPWRSHIHHRSVGVLMLLRRRSCAIRETAQGKCGEGRPEEKHAGIPHASSLAGAVNGDAGDGSSSCSSYWGEGRLSSQVCARKISEKERINEKRQKERRRHDSSSS